MKESQFIHLHCHSHYSLLDGLAKINNLVEKAKEHKMSALALTDHGNLYGAIEFYKACKAAGIKPIVGVELYVSPRRLIDKQAGIDGKNSHITLLAKNLTGYKNLIRLVSIAQLEGFYYKPRVDHETLKKFSEGIICLSGCMKGEFSQALTVQNKERAKDIIKIYQDIFGENYFLEIMYHPAVPNSETVRKEIISLGKEFGILVVATQDAHYIAPEDKKVHEVLLNIQTTGEKKFTFADDDFSFIDETTALKNFADFPEAVTNTKKVADLCNLELTLGKWVFPDIEIPENSNYNDELKKLAYEGFEKRMLSQTPEILKRLDYELEIISKKGYSPYFLVVSDILRFARENKILATTRGSAAGSLVSYLTFITTLNPLDFNLPFERFLNPERPSPPDIDMDFADNRRDEVIEYVKKKYGEDKVAQIGTFGKMMARGAVRDVARALGFPYSVGDRIARLIPFGMQGFPMTIDRALEIVPELKKIYESEKDAKEILDTARKIEGGARHISIHAAGVVIAPEPLYEFVPTQHDPEGKSVITQYDMHSVEEAGLLKFDFLGIRNLSIIADAIERIKKIRGVDIDLEHIPLDDKQTFEKLAKGETVGLFQLNGEGMTKSLMELKPNSIFDINVMVALYRPGPIDNIKEYIARKHGRKPIKYLHPKMKNFLGPTFGVLVYQDDLLMTAIEVAGYSWGEVDKFRKAVGKKIPEEMKKQHVIFVEGCIKNGAMTREKAEALWNLFEPFQGYGFNKCLTGDTKITDSKTGRVWTITEAYKKKISPFILSMNQSNKLEGKKVKEIMKNGVKDIFEITTRTGKKIKATSNHPFYTINGWKNVSELSKGIRIATAETLEKENGKINAIKKAKVLGYLLSEGNLCHPNGIYFYSTQKDELKDFINCASHFKNINFTIDKSKSTVAIYCGVKKQGKNNINEINSWINDLGLRNKKATDKFIPDQVYTWNKESISALIGKMWQGDGCISLKNQQVFYATSSKQLAHDVQYLLLRLGIISTIHSKKFKYRGGYKPGYTVITSHRDNINKFLQTAGKYLIGKKKNQLQQLVNQSKMISIYAARGTKNIIPAEIITKIRQIMKSKNISVVEISKKTNLSPRLFSIDKGKKGYLKSVIKKIGQVLNSKELVALADGNIFWDEIISITKIGKEMTYDLTLPPHHNFVANSLIVHNSHAASYGQVAYQTAYLKAHYPAEYMTAALTAESGDMEKSAELIAECKRLGFQVLPPDINESFSDFTVVRDENENVTKKIRFGLNSIKNFGLEIGKAIIHERKSRGPFKNLADFLTCIQHKNLNKKSLEALVQSGAMDNFGERNTLMASMEDLLRFNKEVANNSSQAALFAISPKLSLKEVPPATVKEKLAWEKELLGLYISGHPLDRIKDKLEKLEASIKKVKENYRDGAPVTLAGVIDSVRTTITKNNEQMAFVKITDMTSSIEAVVFPRNFNELSSILKPDTCIGFVGRVSVRNDEKSIIIEKAKAL